MKGRRRQVLLGLVLDIKNNRRRAGKAAAAAPPALAPAVARFLKDAGVDAVRLRGLPWAKLLAPDKRVRARRRGVPSLARAAQGQQAGQQGSAGRRHSERNCTRTHGHQQCHGL